MKIAMTGVSGNMGAEALSQTLGLDFVDEVRVLITPKKKNNGLARRLKKRYGKRIYIVRGNLFESSACEELICGADYVINMAAVIPPASDKSAQNSFQCNQQGTICLTDAVAAAERQPKFIHISTVALYGNRTAAHPWGRVGDPLLPSAYDAYAMHKLIAERYVLEKGLGCWAVLRQTAMLHPKIIFSNISDGLLFHATLNGPLEWVTARDSGYLIKRIIERDYRGEVADFWNKIYDISGGAANRRTGYDTFADGFSIMGGSPKSFFRPCWCSTRNFHGLWYADGGELDKLFGYRRDTVADFWKAIGKKYRVFKVARILPPALIKLFVFRRLLRNENAPRRWVKKNDEGRVIAFFGGREQALALPKKWRDFKITDRSAMGALEERPEEVFKEKLLSHGYDEEKPVGKWSLDDMNAAATFRGGKCLSPQMSGSPYGKLLWQCCEGHTFSAAPYTVLKGGHWCPVCQPQPWNYDMLAKKMPFYAQVWYDSHSREENYSYWFDKDWNTRCKNLSEEGDR